MTLQLLEPYTLYLDRRNELDLRFGKVLRFPGSGRVVSVDVFNALNSNARITDQPVVRGLPAADRDPQRPAGEVQRQLTTSNLQLTANGFTRGNGEWDLLFTLVLRGHVRSV